MKNSIKIPVNSKRVGTLRASEKALAQLSWGPPSGILTPSHIVQVGVRIAYATRQRGLLPGLYLSRLDTQGNRVYYLYPTYQESMQQAGLGFPVPGDEKITMFCITPDPSLDNVIIHREGHLAHLTEYPDEDTLPEIVEYNEGYCILNRMS